MNVVFAIGCKRYRDPHVASLQYADQDAKRFVETVMGTQDPDNTEAYILHDGHENEDFRPTRVNLLYFLSQGEARDKSTELDFLFFYFSGHGWSSQDGTDYLLTSDSLVNMPEYTAIPVSMLEGHLRNWEAKHVVLFIDACRTVMAGGKSVTIQDESRVNVDSLCPPGMVTFCSCEPGQTSYESDAIHSGVFTYGVCKALGDEGRCSTIQELDEYLNNEIPRISRTCGLPSQTPYSRVQPLGVQKALIVSRSTLEGWGRQEYEESKQPSPEPAGPQELLTQYREYVELIWIDRQLNRSTVESLDARAAALGLKGSDASAAEREVMGDTKEAILERQERLKELYEEARRLHRNQKWQEVLDSFNRVYALDGTYPDPEGLLESARGALERERKVAALYDRGQSHVDAGEWQRALECFEVVVQLKPDYRDAEEQLLQVRQKLAGLQPIAASKADLIHCVRTLRGYKKPVKAVAFSPDGQLLASGSDGGWRHKDDTVWLWRVDNGELLHTMGADVATTKSVSFSPDGEVLASASDWMVRLWRVKNGELLRTMEQPGASFVHGVAFSPGGRLLASGWDDNTVRLWRVEHGEVLRTMEHTNIVYRVAFSPDGKLLASGSTDNTARLWRVDNGELLHTMEHTDEVSSVTFSPDGKLLASGSTDNTVRLWRVDNGELLRTMKEHTHYVSSVSFSPDGKLLASGSHDETVRLWGTNSP